MTPTTPSIPARFLRRLTVGLLLAGCLAAGAASAQQVVLDRPVRAGELILLPDVADDDVFYYVPDQPRLSAGEDGKPRFSFLRWVDNVRSGADEPEAREGEGGGLVHALVALDVTDEQLAEARRELRRLQPGAEIRGPAVFSAGRFALVSAVAEQDGEGGELALTRKVVGIGNAPLLDGEEAAVSLLLTREGAKILWESFQTPTPDVSFSFEMELEGYRAPRSAMIEADFERVYDHQAFAAGVAGTYLAAEIRGAFDDLRESGAIRVTQIGDDEDLESAIQTAYNRILEQMFKPASGGGTPSVGQLPTGEAQKGVLDRASELLERRRKEAKEANAEARTAEARAAQARVEELEARKTATDERVLSLVQRADEAEARARSFAERSAELDADPAATDAIRSRFREITQALQRQAETLRSLAEAAQGETGELDQKIAEARKKAGDAAAGGERSEPSLAVVASYEMKRVRRRGTYTVDLSKSTRDSMTLRFDENVGDLSRFFGDGTTFREVNLDDPLFRQREVVAFLDGAHAGDFGEWVNFVTVQMRKRHENGHVTFDEVRIDRNNFNAQGNRFKLLYGFHGDRDRERFLEYDVKTLWSFVGGATVEEPWTETTAGAVALTPPFERRSVAVEADPDLLADAGVRAVTVRLFSDLNGVERVEQETFRVSRDPLSRRLELLTPADRAAFDYEITWRMRGNRTLGTGRLTTDETLLFVDELPEEIEERTAR